MLVAYADCVAASAPLAFCSHSQTVLLFFLVMSEAVAHGRSSIMAPTLASSDYITTYSQFKHELFTFFCP